MALLAKGYEDTMRFYQEMQQEEAVEFPKVVLKEIHDLYEKQHWNVVERNKVPEHCKVLPSIWSM